jgi:ATP/maltotriose-dependent transcriptional regulator MalT
MDLAADLMDFISADAGQTTLLAIEDLHLVDASPQVVDALGLIARGLPPRWTMLVSSRRPLPLDLEAVVGSPRKVAAWAAQNWGLALERSEARSLWRLSEGWPAALVLLGQQLVSHGRATHADLVGIMSRGRDLRAYLERHILSGLDPLTADVMLTGALLPRLIFPRDAEYLPGAPGEAETALEQLVARGFLVTRSGRRSYTVHPLVRAYAERQAWERREESRRSQAAAARLEAPANITELPLYLRADASTMPRAHSVHSHSHLSTRSPTSPMTAGPTCCRTMTTRPRVPGCSSPKPACCSNR